MVWVEGGDGGSVVYADVEGLRKGECGVVGSGHVDLAHLLFIDEELPGAREVAGVGGRVPYR